MNKKQAWLELCIKYGGVIEQEKNKIDVQSQELDKLILDCYCLGKGIISTIQDESFLFTIDNKCFFCKKPISSIEEAEIGSSYWSIGKNWIKYHKSCKDLKKQNEIEQQKIDCNCNDCKFFKRNGEKTGNKISGFDFKGKCLKLNKLTTGQSIPYCRAFENNECFEHRKN